MHGQLVRHLRRLLRRAQHVPAAQVDGVRQGQGDGLPRTGGRQFAVKAVDALHPGRPAGRQGQDRVAGAHRTAGDGAAEAAEVRIGPIHPLHRQAKGAEALVPLHRHRLKMGQQGRASMPGHGLAGAGDVVPLQRGDGDGDDVQIPQLGGKAPIGALNVGEDGLLVAHQVHLVDRQHEVADAEQRRDVAVPPGLDQQALAGIDQNDRQLRVGGAGGHVAGVLLMAGSVGDHELAPVRAEVAVGHVDGDALLPLRRQAIHQQGEVESAALGALGFAVRRQRRQLVFEHQLGVVQQAADQGAFAVINAAAGEEAQGGLGALPVQLLGQACGGPSALLWRGGGCCVHQKYPSCFFLSMEAAASWSITRPSRSEVRAASISRMMPSKSSALDSRAPVSG